MTTRLPLLLRAALVATVGCAPHGIPHGTRADGARQAIGTYPAQLRDIFVGRHADDSTLARVYAEDVRWIEPDGTVLDGRAALARTIRDEFTQGTASTYDVQISQVRTDGELAYVAGAEHVAGVAGTPSRSGQVWYRFLAVFRRQPDGAWRVEYGMEVTQRGRRD